MLTYGELFAGAGGFGMGFERAGMVPRWQVEIDPWCTTVLERHWPTVARHADVREVGKHNLEPVDVICFGSPCQDMSVAGLRAGLSGERSGLFFEAIRIIGELHPAYVVWENVPGALSSSRGRDFGAVLDALANVGAVDICWRILDARFFGVPQRRRRLFVVASFRAGASAYEVLVESESCGGHPQTRGEPGEGATAGADDGVAFTLPSAHRGIGNGWNTNHVTLAPGAHPGGVTGRDAENGALVVARGLTARNDRLDGDTDNFLIAGTVRASDGHHGHSSPRGDGGDNLVYTVGAASDVLWTENVAQPITGRNGDPGIIAFDWQASSGNDDSWRGKGRQHVVRSGDYAGANSGTRVDAIAGTFGVRRLTPLECTRLMGWPDDWLRWTADGREIPDSHQYRMAGNGVVSTVAEYIGHRLVAVDRMLP